MNSFQPLRFFFWLKKFVAIDSESRQIDSLVVRSLRFAPFKRDTKRDFKLEKIKGPGAPSTELTSSYQLIYCLI